MSKIFHFIKPAAARFMRARGRRRRGSVLILCVVLIVMLALLGTAMLSTTRIDRFTAQQHGYNVQIDLLVEGAKAIVQSELIADLFDNQTGTSLYRPPSEQSLAVPVTSYDHSDMPLIRAAG